MDVAPEIVERPSQPYVAITRSVTMAELGTVLPPLISDVFSWLEAHGQQPAGPPFWKYDVIDMDRELTVEVGVPVVGSADADADDDNEVTAGTLPAGRYATAVHIGDPSGLVDATRALLEWADSQDLAFDTSPADDGEHWAARLEEYLTDPAEEPDTTKWHTRLAFRLR